MTDSHDEFKIEFDVKDESWLQDDNETSDDEPTFDESKLQRDLLPKTVLIDYIRERIKQIHNTRILISDEGEKALMKVIETHLRTYLDKLITVVVDLVQLSNLKTIFRRHILCGDKVLTDYYTNFAGCETDETDK